MADFVGWITTHTRVPAFYASGEGWVSADHHILGSARPRWLAEVKAGDAVLVSDPGAPVGVPITYRFGSESVVLTRPGVAKQGALDYHQMVVTADGELVADVGVLWGDPRSHETGAVVHTSALGSHIPRYTLGVEPEWGTLQMVSRKAGTEVLRRMVGARQPLWVIHNPAACIPEGCDVEGSRLIVPISMSEVLSERRDVYTRVWDVEYQRVPDSIGESFPRRIVGGPVVTWGQWHNWGKKNRPAGWQSWSAIEVARRIAGMPRI